MTDARCLVFGLPGGEALGEALAGFMGADLGQSLVRRFPDGEWYVRLDSPVEGRDVVIAATLHPPEDTFLPVCFLADAARDLGARSVGLAAPYLAYMRQDARFQPGEGITSRPFARMLSGAVDWLGTVDPHLHRYSSLDEIYGIPSAVVPAAPRIAEWIAGQADRPLIVGPDVESARWVGEVARIAGAPFVVLEKTRRGDREVEVSIPDVDRWRDRAPVLVDDIISTARTMIETVEGLRAAGLAAPVCVGVHGIFVDGAYEDLIRAGAARVVTANTIPHPSNAIDVLEDLAGAVTALIAPEAR